MVGDRTIERLIGLAEDQRQRGLHENSIETLRKVLSADPDHALAHALLAHNLLSTGRLYAARIEAETSLRLEPDELHGHFALGAIALAEHHYDECEAHLAFLMAHEPTDFANYLLGAQLRLEQKRPGEAREMLERARQLAPEETSVIVCLGELALIGNDIDEAETFAEKALRNDPEYGDAHLLQGRIDLLRGRPQQAREHAHIAMQHDASDGQALWLMVAIKAHESRWLGLWWRLNVWLGTLDDRTRIIVLIAAFAIMRIAIMLAREFGLDGVALAISLTWLALCVYTWVGPTVFQRTLEREKAPVRFDEDY